MSETYASGVRPIIDDYLARQAAQVRDYGDYWSASSAGYCLRKVIFDRLQVPPVKEDPRKTRVFEAGKIFHEWAQRITRDSGQSIAQEMELLDTTLKIKGHFDDLILLVAPSPPITAEPMPSPPAFNDRLILYDYKTAHSKWFEYKRTDGISYYHKYQLGTYLYMLKKLANIELKRRRDETR